MDDPGAGVDGLRLRATANEAVNVGRPSGQRWGTGGELVADAFPPGVGYLPMRDLTVEVVALPGRHTGVRADAQVQWIPRPRGERIPTRAGVLEVTVARPGAAALVTRTVTDRPRVRRIAALIDRLQTVQPEAINCPSLPIAKAITIGRRVTNGVRR